MSEIIFYKPTKDSINAKTATKADSILHQKSRRLKKAEILSKEIQQLIQDMKLTCQNNNYGVGLSVPQIGRPLAISLIAIKPTPARPNLETFEQVCINPEIIEVFGEKIPSWEGCLSTAIDKNGEPMMARVPRYQKIHAQFFDTSGDLHSEILEGFAAHVFQHETDHVNGVLFTDLVDKSSLITNAEYREIMGIGKR